MQKHASIAARLLHVLWRIIRELAVEVVGQAPFRSIFACHWDLLVMGKAVSEAGLLAETYDSACIFIHVNNGYASMPCATESRLWNDGVNHLMVDFPDITR